MRSKSIRQSIIVLNISFLVLLCACPISTGSSEKPSQTRCTTLTLRLPRYKVAANKPIALTGDVGGAKEILGTERAKLLGFKWTVSQAVIISGQGTPKILVGVAKSVAKTVQDVSVDLEVTGVPPECAHRVAGNLTIDSNCLAPIRFNEYGKVSVEEESAQLERLVDRLKNEPKYVAYIVIYAGRKSCLSEADWRANRIRRYLVDQKAIPKNRVEIIDGGFQDELTTELYLSPCNGCGPLPVSRLMFDDVELGPPCGFEERSP